MPYGRVLFPQTLQLSEKQDYEFEMGWDGSDRSPKRASRMQDGLPVKVRNRGEQVKG